MPTLSASGLSGATVAFGRLRSYTVGSQLRRNMCASAGLTAVGALIAAVSYPLYLGALGYEKYGLWLVLSTVLSVSQISNLGISQAITKHVAANQYDKTAIQEYTTTALAITGLVAVVLWVLSFLLRNPLLAVFHLKPAYLSIAHQVFPLLVLFSAYLFCVDVTNNILNGCGRLDLCIACQILAQLVGFLAALTMISKGMGIMGMLLGNIVGYIVAHIVSWRLVIRCVGGSPFAMGKLRWSRGRDLITFGGWMMGTTVLSLFFNPFNRVAIGKFGTLAEVPIYDIAYSMAVRIRNLFESTQRGLTAEVSRLASIKGHDKMSGVRRLNNKCMLLALAVSPVFIVLGVGIEPLARVWLGARFDPHIVPVARIMLVGGFFSLIGTPGYYILLGLGQARQIFYANVLQSGINACLTAAVITWGLTCNAITTSIIVAIAMAVAALYLVQRSLRARSI
jgi:O-antigen/teichoic acid export membrane protein